MFEHLSTGAADDLAKVTDIARAKETLGEEDLRRLRSPAAENIAAATAVERRPA